MPPPAGADVCHLGSRRQLTEIREDLARMDETILRLAEVLEKLLIAELKRSHRE